jgi:ferredoxin-type protein NapH
MRHAGHGGRDAGDGAGAAGAAGVAGVAGAAVAAGAPKGGRVRRAWRRHRWQVARRALQGAVLLALAAGAWWGVGVAQGTLASSRWFGALTLTDPFVLLQSLAAGHVAAPAAWGGAAVVALALAAFGGRAWCGWVCPVNPLSDLVAALRRRLGLGPGLAPWVDRRLRIVLALAVLAASAAGGVIAWETVNPITLLQRLLFFGAGAVGSAGVAVLVALLAFDLLALRRGWCGRLCPVGACYAELGRAGAAAVRDRVGLRVAALRTEDCTRCGACHAACPEPQVLVPVLPPRRRAGRADIVDADCTRCARCIEVCEPGVFAFALTAGRRR